MSFTVQEVVYIKVFAPDYDERTIGEWQLDWQRIHKHQPHVKGVKCPLSDDPVHIECLWNLSEIDRRAAERGRITNGHKRIESELKCEVCDTSFVAKRRDAKYCSARCRQNGARRGHVTINHSPLVAV